jgi:hypothetical protein
MNERRQTQATTQAGSLFPAINSGDDDGADGPRQRACGQRELAVSRGLAAVISLYPDHGGTSPTVDVLPK